jgi:hypothetical protein
LVQGFNARNSARGNLIPVFSSPNRNDSVQPQMDTDKGG